MAKRNVFTFQYVSILMGIEPINPTLKEIYIPICFYFNNKQAIAGVNYNNLHSNMFLF